MWSISTSMGLRSFAIIWFRTCWNSVRAYVVFLILRFRAPHLMSSLFLIGVINTWILLQNFWDTTSQRTYTVFMFWLRISTLTSSFKLLLITWNFRLLMASCLTIWTRGWRNFAIFGFHTAWRRTVANVTFLFELGLIWFLTSRLFCRLMLSWLWLLPITMRLVFGAVTFVMFSFFSINSSRMRGVSFNMWRNRLVTAFDVTGAC